MSGYKCSECKLEYDPAKHLLSKSKGTQMFLCDDCYSKTPYSESNLFGRIRDSKCKSCKIPYDRDKDEMVKIKGDCPLCTRCFQDKYSHPASFAIFVKAEWNIVSDDIFKLVDAVHSQQSHWVNGKVFTLETPVIQKLLPLMKHSGVWLSDTHKNRYATRERLPIPDNWENISLDAAHVALEHYSPSSRGVDHLLDDDHTLWCTPKIARMLAQIRIWLDASKDHPYGYRPPPEKCYAIYPGYRC